MTAANDNRPRGGRSPYWIGGVMLLLLVAYLAFWPVPVDPVAWVADVNRGMTGAFSRSRPFGEAGFEAYELGPGPEDVALGPDGMLYSGLQDGRIMRLRISKTFTFFIFSIPLIANNPVDGFG